MLIFSGIVKDLPIFNENGDLRHYGDIAFGVTLTIGILTLGTGLLGLIISKKFSRKMSVAVSYITQSWLNLVTSKCITKKESYRSQNLHC